jgi:hypothetical protein
MEKVMFFILGTILISRFVNSLDCKSGRRMLIDTVTFIIFILSIPVIWY